MIKKAKLQVIPAYYNNADKNWVNSFIERAEGVLKKTNTDYEFTAPLSTLDDSAKIKSQVRASDCDAVILYLITWIDPNVAVDLLLGLKGYPAIVWSSDYKVIDNKKQQTGAFAAFLPIKGSLEQLGFNALYLYDTFSKKNTSTELSEMIAAASTVSKLRTSRIGMVGNTALGIYPGMVNPLQVKKLFGTEIVHLDNYTLIELCKKILNLSGLDKEMKSFFHDYIFTEPVTDKQKLLCVAMTKAVRQLVSEHKLSAISLKCCYELAIDFGFAPCVPLSILSDEFVTSCECDIPVTLTQLIMSYIAGKPSPYADLLIMEDYVIHCACCGFGAYKYAAGSLRQIGCSQTGQNENELTFNRLINNSQYENGVYTLARLNFPQSGKPVLQIILGEHANIQETFCEFGCKQYQNLSLKLNTMTSKIIDNIGSQHFAIMQGDMTSSFTQFCKFMNIEMQKYC